MIDDIRNTAETKMQRSLEVLKENLAKVRTGRAHTGLLDQVSVEYYGSDVPVSQVASVTLLDARTIGVKPFESSMAGKIEKAIRDSNLGLNPAAVGDLIRVPMPMLTEERCAPKPKKGAFPSATCAAMPTTTSNACSKTKKSPKTKRGAAKKPSKSSPTKPLPK